MTNSQFLGTDTGRALKCHPVLVGLYLVNEVGLGSVVKLTEFLLCFYSTSAVTGIVRTSPTQSLASAEVFLVSTEFSQCFGCTDRVT